MSGVMRLSDLIVAMGGTDVGLMHDPVIAYFDSYHGLVVDADPEQLRLIVDGIGPGAIKRLILDGAS